jgi:PAS domain S-box-containing protein
MSLEIGFLLTGKIRLAFASAILALLVVGGISYRSVSVSGESDGWVRHSHEVIERIQNMLLGVSRIESDAQAFILTGDDYYLRMLPESLGNLRADRDGVAALIKDNAGQYSAYAALDADVDKKISNAYAAIAARRAGDSVAAVALLQGESQRYLEDDFMARAAQLQAEERRLLAERNDDIARRLGQTRMALLVGTVLGLLVAGAALWGVQRDSAMRARVEGALLESDKNYRMLLDSARDYAIFMLDPRGLVVSWSAGAESIHGYTAEEIVGRSFACFFLPEAVQAGRPAEILRIAAARGRHQEYDLRMRKDGKQFLADVIFTALRDPAGKLRGFSEISRDLSESKESEAKYRALLEAAPDAMVVVDQAGEIVLLNVRAEKQFGYSRDELLGQKIKNIIPEGFAERLIADALRSAEDALAQQIGAGIELSGRRRDGSVFPIEIMLSPLKSAEGVLVTAAIRNISARKNAEAHLLQKVEELNRSNQELGHFAHVASHDLQEPLRMVASYTQLLSKRYKGKLDQDADDFIAYAVDGASRMQRLIQGLLAYSHVASKGKDLLGLPSAEAVQQAIMNLGGAIEESGARVTVGVLPTVLADEVQLIQLFQNLIGNAIKYQHPGIPEVHISAERAGAQKWMFSVSDNGIGIEPQYFERIFGMFQRLHKREEFAGTGIGLAICKKIVERHGGELTVESHPGQGSTFRFALAEGGTDHIESEG